MRGKERMEGGVSEGKEKVEGGFGEREGVGQGREED